MFIPGPDFCPSRIPDPKTATKERDEKIFCGQKYKKIENYLIFELVKKTMWATSQRIIEFLPKKLSLSSQKYRFGIQDLEKTYSGSRIRFSNTDFMR
jgi:hypothetical protein